MKKYWLAVLFLFSLTVNYATFVSNDKVNERIFQRELALPEYFFFLSKTGQTGAVWKKTAGEPNDCQPCK